MLASFRRKVEPRQLDQVQVDLIVEPQDSMFHELSREGHHLNFIELHGTVPPGHQNSPVMRPSSVSSILLAAGTRGNPGIVMISPHTATMNSAPADSRISRTPRI